MSSKPPSGFNITEYSDRDDKRSTGGSSRPGSSSKQGMQEVRARQHYYEQQQKEKEHKQEQLGLKRTNSMVRVGEGPPRARTNSMVRVGEHSDVPVLTSSQKQEASTASGSNTTLEGSKRPDKKDNTAKEIDEIYKENKRKAEEIIGHNNRYRRQRIDVPNYDGIPENKLDSIMNDEESSGIIKDYTELSRRLHKVSDRINIMEHTILEGEKNFKIIQLYKGTGFARIYDDSVTRGVGTQYHALKKLDDAFNSLFEERKKLSDALIQRAEQLPASEYIALPPLPGNLWSDNPTLGATHEVNPSAPVWGTDAWGSGSSTDAWGSGSSTDAWGSGPSGSS